MKTYDDLSKKEQERFLAYITTKNYMNSSAVTFITSIFILLAVGYALISLMTTMTTIVGFALIMGAIFLLLVLAIEAKRIKKITRIIFDIEDFSEEIFEIKKSDLMNMQAKFMRPKEK